MHVFKNGNEHLDKETKSIKNSQTEEELDEYQNNDEALQAFNCIYLSFDHKTKNKIQGVNNLYHQVEYVPGRRKIFTFIFTLPILVDLIV